ncbi:nucleoside monophosphate kinase [Candidatus Saccharibacteria bacterium]|nr:nucleoside monophosphate kinase [Candidatus Saccharibacteria bacterium]
MDQNAKLTAIRQWLGTGSINIFGLPFSGRETTGRSLALALGAVYISGGEIIRHSGRQLSRTSLRTTNNGGLLPATDFENLILPYLKNETYRDYPLILDSVGRRMNEGHDTVDAAAAGGHPIKIAIVLNVSENEARNRWKISRLAHDRDDHLDDREERYLDERFALFRKETEPVIAAYRHDGILIAVHGNQERPAVVAEAIDKLYEFTQKHP